MSFWANEGQVPSLLFGRAPFNILIGGAIKIPSKFIIKGKTWQVKYKKNLKADGYDCDGVCDYGTRTITLKRGLSKDGKKATFLHELFHVIVHEAHINHGTKFGSGLEEVLADAFVDCLSTLFKVSWRAQK